MKGRSSANVLLVAALCILCISLLATGGSALREGKKRKHALHYQNCHPLPYQSNITQVKMHPYPPKPGDKITLVVEGEHGRQVDGGELDFGVYFHGVPLYHGKEDLCMRSSCGHETGHFRYRAVEQLPVFTPPGPYHLRLRVKDKEGDELLCIKTKLNVLPAKV